MITEGQAVQIAEDYASRHQLSIGKLIKVWLVPADKIIAQMTPRKENADMVKDNWYVLFDLSDEAKCILNDTEGFDCDSDILITVEAESGNPQHEPPIGIG